MSIPSPNRLRLVFFPDYIVANPYQALLYRSLEPTVRAQPGTIDEAGDLQARADTGQVIFHLHWDDELTQSPNAAEARTRVGAFLGGLESFRDAGGRVVWTIHNLDSHHGQNRDLTDELRSRLIALADVIHVHSLPALAALRQRWDIPSAKLRVIAHGDYSGHYPRFGRDAAREDLGLSDRRMVVVLPGRIASYKNADTLIEAFRDCAGDRDTLALVGFVTDSPKHEAAPDDPRIVIKGGFADPPSLGKWISAADFVALPYLRSLTSGSAILAASLGRAVFGARTPGLVDAVEAGRTGLLYDPAEPGACTAALAAALGDGPQIWAERGVAAWEASRARDWHAIGHQWTDVLARLRDRAPAGPMLEVA